MSIKKVLIISNDACCGNSSNGRTIMNFFLDYPKEKLAQFCIHGKPDETFCERFYRNSDSDALRTFLYRSKNPPKTYITESKSSGSSSPKKVKKSCLFWPL